MHATFRYVWERLFMLINSNFNFLREKKVIFTDKYISLYG